MYVEHITITKKFQKNAVEAKVSFVELIGRELHVHLTAGEKTLIAIAKPTQRLEVGQQIWLTFDGRKIHIFDKKNPKRP